MRVGIIALLHESNTFIAQPTTIEHFWQQLLLRGNDVQTEMAGTHHEVAGFFDELDRTDVEAVGLLAARALPFGTVNKATFAHLMDCLFDELRKAGRLDGILVAPHGATVSERFPDADGHWLTRLRDVVGDDIPIMGTLDPHANLSPAMVRATDALVAYRSNPHLDQRDRGAEAARLLVRTLRGEIRPRQAAAMPPCAINIECQQSTVDPCLSLYHLADSQLQHADVLSNSILLGFPYADVAEMGSSFLCVTDGNQHLAQQLADELARYLWQHRRHFDPVLTGIDETLDRAAQLDGPICLLDMGDNVGGGSPADGTLLAHALHQRKFASTFVCLYDPQAVAKAAAAGVGSRQTLSVGGKTDDLHGQPLTTKFRVLSIHEGRFEEPQPRHGGFTKMDQGRTVILETEYGLTVMLTSRRMPPFSLCQLTSCGIDPQSFWMLVAKGVNAPVAAYAPICKHLLRVNTPGVTTADMKSLDYRYRRRPMFPFELDAEW